MPSKKKARDIKKVAIIGAGTMGSAIAQRLAQEGLDVVLADNKPEAVKAAEKNIGSSLKDAVAKGLMTQSDASEVRNRILITEDPSMLSYSHLVIEAIFEDLDAKVQMFRYLDKACVPSTIFASNTSALPIKNMALATKRPGRFIGLHFFYPAHKNRLVEVIPWKGTSKDTLSKVLNLCKRAGLVPIVVRDSPGFAINRLFVPWLNEAAHFVDDIFWDIPTVEAASKEAFGITNGPFELMNMTGIEIAQRTAKNLEPLGQFYKPATALSEQWLKDQPWKFDGEPDRSKMDYVRSRMLGVVFHEACQLLDQRIVSIEDLERGARIGLRWPRGPFELMNVHGKDGVRRIMSVFYERHPYLSMPGSLSKWLGSDRSWTFRYVELHKEGDIARIVINRPETMNAINEEVLAQFEKQFISASKDKGVRAIVLEGVGKAFMAGADINFFIEKIEKGKIDDIVSMTKRAHRLANMIGSSKKLVIAKLDGVAVGGGAEFAMVADIVVASPRARIGFPETGIGLYPGLGGTQRLPRIIGKELAKYLIFTGKIIDAATAKELGLVQYIAGPAELDELIEDVLEKKKPSRLGTPPRKMGRELEIVKGMFSSKGVKAMLSGKTPEGGKRAQEICRLVSTKAPLALRTANELIDDGMTRGLEAGLELEMSRLKEIFSTKDALIGLRAVGKTRPVFEGR